MTGSPRSWAILLPTLLTIVACGAGPGDIVPVEPMSGSPPAAHLAAGPRVGPLLVDRAALDPAQGSEEICRWRPEGGHPADGCVYTLRGCDVHVLLDTASARPYTVVQAAWAAGLRDEVSTSWGFRA